MYLNTLPTVEDIRDYPFPGVKPASEAQKTAASKFIDALDLEDPEEECEELKPSSTFNPVLQYFYQCMQFRALNPEQALPELEENIAK